MKAWGLADLGIGAELTKAAAKVKLLLPRQLQLAHQEHVAEELSWYFQLRLMAGRWVVQAHQEVTLVPGEVGIQRVAVGQSLVAQDMRVLVVDP